MISLLVCVVLTALVLATISLQKTYSTIPLRELKRRARAGDEFASLMHRAVTFGASLQILLWVLIGVSSALLFVGLTRVFPAPGALVAIIVIIWFGFAWVPNTRVTTFGRNLAHLATPVLAWVLNCLQPILSRLGKAAQKHVAPTNHTKLYQKEDILDLLDQQAQQSDNRLSREELDIAKHALTFGDKLVRDYMTPRGHVVSVNANEKTGPVLMDMLHKSGHTRFPVFDDKPDNIVGTLYMQDLVAHKSGGTVKSVAKSNVLYAHDSQTLYQTLMAFLKTKHHLFIVVNSFEEVVGIITLEDVIEQILGRPIMDEFDQFEDLRAVATHAATQIHKEQKHEDLPPDTPEVIE